MEDNRNINNNTNSISNNNNGGGASTPTHSNHTLASAAPFPTATNPLSNKRLSRNEGNAALYGSPNVDDEIDFSEYSGLSSCFNYPPPTKPTLNEGSIILNIMPFSKLRSKVSSSWHNIGNLPWRLSAKTECTPRTQNIRYFSVYIDCNTESESSLWSCDAYVELKIVSHKAGQEGIVNNFRNDFSYSKNNWGFPTFATFSLITNAGNGLIVDDKLVLEATIKINHATGIFTIPTIDFTSPHAYGSDVIFEIEGKQLHVLKALLSLYSPVLQAMFYSGFAEASQQKIVLKDVYYNEFHQLLEVIYPTHRPIDEHNVEFLLELGDRFEISYVIIECEKFLMSLNNFPFVRKLFLADLYKLSNLQNNCIKHFDTPSEIKAIGITNEYKLLSDSTKAALLDKMFKLL
uniref:BTB domain-containing protein n=1 Tax=Rhabditophanes sp. KR3021 TaxID=114890 RepID=A0AC35U0Y4_9BILA